MDKKRIKTALKLLDEKILRNLLAIAEGRISSHFGMERHEQLCAASLMLKQKLTNMEVTGDGRNGYCNGVSRDRLEGGE